MKKYVLLVVGSLLLSIHVAWATHIVGGELELTSINGRDYTYKLALNLYFDVINGEPGAEDDVANVVIYSKRTNQALATIALSKTDRQLVAYTNPVCVNERLSTRLIRYEREIILQPEYFSEIEGYYAVWERCCRNRTIINIRNPEAAGNSFYLEFPAVYASNKAFINSSPTFTIPKGDYACVNRPFVFDFSATDADGDELQYSLVTPFTGYSTQANPRPLAASAPYPTVQWISGVDLNRVIPGPEPLRVNKKTGQLTFTAAYTGLFVFSVLCEEYRAGKKIGQVRRDFQILVVDCPANAVPAVQLKEKEKPAFYREGEVILLKASQTDRCMDLLLTDASGQENVRLQIIPVNFPANVVSISPSVGSIRNAQDTLRSQLCWTDCAASEPGKPYEFDVIVQDDGCPLPSTDTLHVKLIIEPLPNQAPAVQTDLPENTATVLEGNTLTFNVTGLDADKDQITLEAVGRGFDLKELGMSFTNGTAQATLTTPFVWNPPCEKVKAGQTYTVDFIVTDKRCPDTGKKDTVSVNLRFQTQPNQQPEVSTTLPDNTTTVNPGQPPIQLDVLGTDPDQNTIVLKAIGRGFSMEEAGMVFNINVTGVGRIKEPFSWVPDCRALELKPDGEFIVDFLLQDNTCAPNNADTVSITLQVKDLEYTIPTDSVPNVFTPDGLGANETFQIMQFLPPDNCRDQFVKVEIYNRWGKLAFESTSRESNWTGFGFPPGVYYYVVKYRESQYKGTVSLLR